MASLFCQLQLTARLDQQEHIYLRLALKYTRICYQFNQFITIHMAGRQPEFDASNHNRPLIWINSEYN